jgi:hypothetical protein
VTTNKRVRLSRDPGLFYSDVSEFGLGPGRARPGIEMAPPSDGGVYRPKCPPVEPNPSDDLSIRVRETPWRPGDPPRGYPGDRIG